VGTKVRAALLRTPGEGLVDAEVTLPEPGPGQVRVRIAAAGVCHSDLSLAGGALPQQVPAVLGHEASGYVDEVGEGVAGLEGGQPVVLNWSPSCGECWFCRHGEFPLCEHAGDAALKPYASLPDGEGVFAGLGTAGFAEQTLVPASAVVPLPDGVDVHDAALLGCAVLTGLGAVLWTAQVQPDQSVAVIGLGGVGLSAVQGARIAGAGEIVAVDASPEKEELARGCGATRFATAGDAKDVVRAVTGGRGVDQAFECVGKSATIRAAWGLARRGGSVTVVGVGRGDDQVSFSALELFWMARTVRGCVYGSSHPARDLPRVAGWIRDGSLSVDALVTDRVPGTAAAINEAFARMQAGHGGRTLLIFD
jgi:S-(hydroxymethyl)glutathione dehydrogenase/alcohol dehydrogenase